MVPPRKMNVPSQRSPGPWCGWRRLAAVACLALTVIGCTYRGNRVDSPIVRKVSWFSYLDGTDIRDACAAGTLDRYRLVYNARYSEQRRSYEVVADAADGASLTARAMGGEANLAALSPTDPQAPWRWRKSTARLSPEVFADFQRRLLDSGFAAGAPVGLRLYSEEFYWVAGGCMDGSFHFAAWVHPSPGFAKLAFPAFLFAHDDTGLAVNQPRPLHGEGRFAQAGGARNRTQTRFMLQVGQVGLSGASGLF